MGALAAIVLIVVGIVGAAISQVLADDFKAWTIWIVECLIKRALLKAPPQLCERLDEEWHSHVNDIPGHIGKLVVAGGFLVASSRFDLQAAGPAEKTAEVFEPILAAIEQSSMTHGSRPMHYARVEFAGGRFLVRYMQERDLPIVLVIWALDASARHTVQSTTFCFLDENLQKAVELQIAQEKKMKRIASRVI